MKWQLLCQAQKTAETPKEEGHKKRVLHLCPVLSHTPGSVYIIQQVQTTLWRPLASMGHTPHSSSLQEAIVALHNGWDYSAFPKDRNTHIHTTCLLYIGNIHSHIVPKYQGYLTQLSFMLCISILHPSEHIRGVLHLQKAQTKLRKSSMQALCSMEEGSYHGER